MKIKLMAHEDDTFTLDIETVPGMDPTGAEADFISQVLETAFPNTQLQDFVHDQVRQAVRMQALPTIDTFVEKLTAFDGARTPEEAARTWAQAVVEVVQNSGVDRDMVLRALAEELNAKGVLPTDHEMRIKGGPWQSQKRGPDVTFEDVAAPDEAELRDETTTTDAEDLEILRDMGFPDPEKPGPEDSEGPPSPRRSTPTPTPKDLARRPQP